MSVFRMKMPDVGEGVAEAEIVSWAVAVGDPVTPDSVLAEVLTDKATIEVSSPVTGVVAALYGEPGDVLAVGSELVDIDVEPGTTDEPDETDEPVETDVSDEPAAVSHEESADNTGEPVVEERDEHRPSAAPAVRARARDLGLDLASVRGSGPEGRVVHADLDRLITAGEGRSPVSVESTSSRTEPVRGVRRRIAERLTEAWEVPHITYVEAVDVTEVERLRSELNARDDREPRLTLLPFLAKAIALAVADQPRLNSHHHVDDATLEVFDAVHVGIATQTDDGLLVPVVRHVESRALHEVAGDLSVVTAAARDGSATREQLSGSTITITSLGALGGLMSTPILNPPEVAIVGVNKIETRPVWQDGQFVPRRIMNLSSSFDHRIVDGWDAATFVQRIRSLLESPALLFIGNG